MPSTSRDCEEFEIDGQWFSRGNRSNVWLAVNRPGGNSLADRVPSVCWPFLEEIARLRAAQSESGLQSTLEEANRCYLQQFDRAEALQRALNAKQAELDRVMIEYCPDEMTAEQTANWAKHQRPVP